jgi:hypothetical protein
VVEALVSLGPALPGQQERNQVRDQHGLQPIQVLLRGELVERVELQELQPRGGVEPCRVQLRVDLGDGGAAAFVAVAVRLRGEFAVLVDQAVVHRPGVDADAGDRFPALNCRLASGSETGKHLGEEGVEVPAEAAVGLHHSVGETVHDVERGPRRTAVGLRNPALMRPRITRPEEAPMSTAANRPPSTLAVGTVLTAGRLPRRRRPRGYGGRWCARVRCW